MPLYCFDIEQLALHNHFWGTKQTVPAQQRKDGALFWYSFETKAKRAKSSINFKLLSCDNLLSNCSYQFIVLDKLFCPHSLQWHIKIKRI